MKEKLISLDDDIAAALIPAEIQAALMELIWNRWKKTAQRIVITVKGKKITILREG